MDTKTRIIGHPTLRAADIAPNKAASFSPNLHKYLSARGVFFRDGGLLHAVYAVKPDTKAAKWFGAGTLLLGFIDDEFFTGSRLIAVLCNGSKADRAAYPGVTDGLELVEGFWDRYLELGRCAIDPSHQEHFLGNRFQIHGDTRTCLWCNHRQRKVLTPRIVHDTTWITE